MTLRLAAWRVHSVSFYGRCSSRINCCTTDGMLPVDKKPDGAKYGAAQLRERMPRQISAGLQRWQPVR
jgi:hypothetical protein